MPELERFRQAFEQQIFIRKSALAKFRPLGFPTIVFPCEMTANPMKEALLASMFIAKYGAIIVLSDFEGHSMFPLAGRTDEHVYRSAEAAGNQRRNLRN